jgi:leucyl/phenylalanyl-tRNA--protein transferase
VSLHSPVEPPPNQWYLPDLALAPDDEDLVGVGADLEPGTLLAAYRSGLFPMHVNIDDERPVGWWSPNPRAVMDNVYISRSLRRSLKRFQVTVDTDFSAVMAACARGHQDGQWIDDEIIHAFHQLFDLGWAHSVEVRTSEGELVGGLYGVSIGGFFAGESMFHVVPDASKVALVHLKAILDANGDARNLLDVQWRTDHLASMGAVELPRTEYVVRLKQALAVPTINFEALSRRAVRLWLEAREAAQ